MSLLQYFVLQYPLSLPSGHCYNTNAFTSLHATPLWAEYMNVGPPPSPTLAPAHDRFLCIVITIRHSDISSNTTSFFSNRLSPSRCCWESLLQGFKIFLGGQ
jgi:hypothetical protein